MVHPNSLANLRPKRAKDSPGKTVPLLTRITPEQKSRLEAIVAKDQITMGQLIRQIINDFLSRV